MNVTLYKAAVIAAGFLFIVGCKKEDAKTTETCSVDGSRLIEERVYQGDYLNSVDEFYHDGQGRLAHVKNGNDRYEVIYSSDDTVEAKVENWEFYKEFWFYNSDHLITSGLRTIVRNFDTVKSQYLFYYSEDKKLKSYAIKNAPDIFDSVNLTWVGGNITAKDCYKNSQLVHSEYYRYFSDKPGRQHLSFLHYVQYNRYSYLYLPFTYYAPLATKNLIKDVRQIVPDLDTSIIIEYKNPAYDNYGRLNSIEPTYTRYEYTIDTATNQLGWWPLSESFRNEYILECN